MPVVFGWLFHLERSYCQCQGYFKHLSSLLLPYKGKAQNPYFALLQLNGSHLNSGTLKVERVGVSSLNKDFSIAIIAQLCCVKTLINFILYKNAGKSV
jgi:hypothetical protein